MLKRVVRWMKKIYLKSANDKALKRKMEARDKYFKGGQIPWSHGYVDFKEESIIKNVQNESLLSDFRTNNLPEKYGYRLDERIVEYPWIFSNIKKEKTRFLDAGSTFNFDFLLDLDVIKNKEMSIYTFYPESVSYNNSKRISYVYGDLRDLPFREGFFEEIVCQSTIEHIDMDNSMYGYDLQSTLDSKATKSYEYLKVTNELLRVLKSDGQLLLTFPYGKFENHDFFQQFDREMVARIIDQMDSEGQIQTTFFKYNPEGWTVAQQQDCDDSESYNPHTQKGKKDDFAAHSRAVCCIKFIKK